MADVFWWHGIEYAKINKRFVGDETPVREGYGPSQFIRVRKVPVMGRPDPKEISTSFIERQNLTVRMHSRRFERLTKAFSKKLDNLKAALALHFAWYNFVLVHRTLRAGSPDFEGYPRDGCGDCRSCVGDGGAYLSKYCLIIWKIGR